MIDSETINFELLGYGNFMIDKRGLKYLGNMEGVPYDEEADELSQSFNAKYAVRSHITPLEALDNVAQHFLSKKSDVKNVEVTNQKEIEASTSDLTY